MEIQSWHRGNTDKKQCRAAGEVNITAGPINASFTQLLAAQSVSPTVTSVPTAVEIGLKTADLFGNAVGLQCADFTVSSYSSVTSSLPALSCAGLRLTFDAVIIATMYVALLRYMNRQKDGHNIAFHLFMYSIP